MKFLRGASVVGLLFVASVAFAAMNSRVDLTHKAKSKLQLKLDELESRTHALEEQLESLEDRMSAQETDLESHGVAHVDQVQGEGLRELQRKWKPLDEEFRALKSREEKMRSAIDALANPNRAAEIEHEMSKLEAERAAAKTDSFANRSEFHLEEIDDRESALKQELADVTETWRQLDQAQTLYEHALADTPDAWKAVQKHDRALANTAYEPLQVAPLLPGDAAAGRAPASN